MNEQISIRDSAIYEWANYVIKNHIHRYNFGDGKSFYTSLFEAPKMFQRDIVCSVISIAEQNDLSDEDNYDIKDARETAIKFLDEKGWR
jgi:predicted RNA-binding protein with PUA-like domain